jgi:hypothetical protein
MISINLIKKIKRGEVGRIYFSRVLWKGTCAEYNREANKLTQKLEDLGINVCVDKKKCHQVFHTLRCLREDCSKNFMPLMKKDFADRKIRDNFLSARCLRYFEISPRILTDEVIEILHKTEIYLVIA